MVVEAAHHACRGCSRAVLGEAPVQLQHVLRRLPLGTRGPPLGPPSREVHAGQKVAEEVPGVKQRLISRPVGAEGTACAPARRRQQQDIQPEDGAPGHTHGREEERRTGARSEDEKIRGGETCGRLVGGRGTFCTLVRDDWLPLGTTRTVLLPRLIWRVGCEGRAVLGLKGLEMSLWPRLALLSRPTRRDRTQLTPSLSPNPSQRVLIKRIYNHSLGDSFEINLLL